MGGETDSGMVERLERRVHRLERVVLAMGAMVAGAVVMGATSKPEELSLRRLSIVDAQGEERIGARVEPDGTARLSFTDLEKRPRIFLDSAAWGGRASSS